MKKLFIAIFSFLFFATCYLFFNQPAQVVLVKNGKLSICPNKNVEQIVDGFILHPLWKLTRLEDQQAKVSISGQVLVEEKKTPIRIVFWIDEKANKFDLESVILKDEVQLPFVSRGVLLTMCEASKS